MSLGSRGLSVKACLAAIVFASTVGQFVIRDTPHGKVRGAVKTVLESKKVENYLGIPYAAPPVGELRFEYPQELPPWEGIKNTTSLPPACPQTGWGYVELHVPGYRHSDEDCLYMNIYVPQTGGTDSKMAVLVHIHGGSNVAGMGAMFSGDVLAVMGEIIVVTFNYRLGAFGFLSGERPEFPGNYGLMDQTAALKWVAKNIHCFGGDPTKVTVEGHSAGGGNVGLHIVSPLSKGLFRYAVMQSGSPMAYWALLRPPESAMSRTIRFAEKLGCHSDDKHDMQKIKECLKTKSWRDINSEPYERISRRVTFAPVIDNVFVVSDPVTAIKKHSLNGESFMTGITRDEGTFRAVAANERIPNLMLTSSAVKTITNLETNIDLVVHEYKPWDDPDNQTANLLAVAKLRGDLTFVVPAVQVANCLAERTNNVYFYSFEYCSPHRWLLPWPTKFSLGVPHGRDLFYLFGYPFVGHPFYIYTEEDRQVSRTLMNMWSNFVKTGKPTLNAGVKTIDFPHYDAYNQTYMRITGVNGNGSITTAQRLRPRKVAFWNSFLPRMSRKPLNHDTKQYGLLTSILAVLCGILLVCLVGCLLRTLQHRNNHPPSTSTV